MFPAATMSNSTNSLSEEASVSSGTRVQDFTSLNPILISSFIDHNPSPKIKKKRSLPGNPDPEAEVIALSPKTLLATNRFVCEICNKGFQRDQNLQLHRRGHNLPWKLKQRNSKEIKKKAYVCPEASCVHHDPSRALGDLTGIKKHFCRKHGEKKWKCDKCSKVYAVQSDWKAHSKTCGTREYRCDCGTLFSRKDSFITHRAFCDALAEESARLSANQLAMAAAAAAVSTTMITTSSQPLFPFGGGHGHHGHQFSNSQLPQPPPPHHMSLNPWDHDSPQNPNPNNTILQIKPEESHFHQIPTMPLSTQHSSSSHKSSNMITSPFRNLHVTTSNTATSAHLSATALLQKAATVGAAAAKSAGQTESVGHMTRHHHLNTGMGMRMRMGIEQFETLSHVDSLSQFGPEYGQLGGFTNPTSIGTWPKSDQLTRDFLGLTGDGNGNGGGGVDVSMSVKDMLTYAGGLEMQGHHQHPLFKSHTFGYAEPTASETWGDC